MTRVADAGSDTEDRATLLRALMVEKLHDLGVLKSERVAAAVAAVPRHLFAPDEPLEAAYHPDSPLTVKRDEAGAALSSVSATLLQAVMLEQAQVEPGMRVLEIGSGGYNAALIREIVGETGRVTTVDIDPDIVDRARSFLDAAGYTDVEVVLADADGGVAANAPYDRIIVTVGAWYLADAWLEQLAPGGRIVVPLRIKGVTRSIAFTRDAEGLVSDSYGLCRFVPMQGAGAHEERFVTVDDGLQLLVDDERQDFDVSALRIAVHRPGIVRWSGAVYELPDELELFLLTSGPQVALLFAQQGLIDSGLFAASAALGVPALVRSGSIAYRTRRENEETGGFESGVIAHGPNAEEVAAEYIALLQRWATHHRRRGAAQIRYFPKTTGHPDDLAPQRIAKRSGAVEVSWS
ncbi:methyltransferase, FxLD system [Actinocorallia sp. A-T 12471]|uniref:methyltransferase, FxLD system n=1 Tax=Actinocorallia sp. A-T 12471 TaxID=3089813 RepID=UPI0029D2A508|nr:methyltransferase, FxLD system [Actinocorallia sp. A-T 12471]MDX6742930.1 methyltransferase, FxLD system [Actinocorallia sp. A-T 12471]